MDAGIDLRLFSSPGRRAKKGLDGIIGNSDKPKPLILNNTYGRTPGTEVFVGHFAVRFEPKVQRFYERKRQQKKGNDILAIRAVAHKLARAVFHMLKKHEPFDVDRAFG